VSIHEPKGTRDRNTSDEIATRAYRDATPEEYTILRHDANYASPMSFYGDALGFGLITKNEYDIAKASHCDMWNYCGD
jgi:hypothetical protein